MSRKRLTTWACVLAIGVLGRAAVATPRTATAELRAASCCAERCPTAPRRPMQPNRCCSIGSGATDPASTPVRTTLERPATTPIVLAALAPLAPGPAHAALADGAGAGHVGPPGRLATCKLQR